MGTSCSNIDKQEQCLAKTVGSPSPCHQHHQSTESLPYEKIPSTPTRTPADGSSDLASPIPPEKSDSAIRRDSHGSEMQDSGADSRMSTASRTARSAEFLDILDLETISPRVKSLLMGRVLEVDWKSEVKEISVYMCADYQDSELERCALRDRVFPELRQYCAEHDYDLNVTDLHTGVPGDCLENHRFHDVCLSTLNELKKQGHLITLVFFSDKLGSRLLPRIISETDFDLAVRNMESADERELFHKWYLADGNQVPPSYVLQPIFEFIPGIGSNKCSKAEESIERWFKESRAMVEILKRIFDEEQREKYLTLTLESEIKNTILSDDSETAKNCLWIERRFTSEQEQEDGDVDESNRVAQLKAQLTDRLPETRKLVFDVSWRDQGLVASDSEEQAQYLDDLCTELGKKLKKKIKTIIEEVAMDDGSQPYIGIGKTLFQELAEQSLSCRKFSSSMLKQPEIVRLMCQYLESNSSLPLIVHGPAGCGKTSLISLVASQSHQWLPDAPVVVRLIGTTAESGTLEQILRSVSEQCCILYNEHPSLASKNIQEHTVSFVELLSKACPERPLVIMIDGLDQVAVYSSRTTTWIPKELPFYVKLILTVRDGSKEFKELKAIFSDKEGCFIAMQDLSSTESLGIVKSGLEEHQRNITEPQLGVVRFCLFDSPYPRYSSLIGKLASTWPSIRGPEELLKDKSVEGVIVKILALVNNFAGERLAAFILGVLIASKHGLSDSEMLDVLSCDQSVLDRVLEYGHGSVRRFPDLLWAVVKHELSILLRWRIVGNRKLITWRTEIYRTVCRDHIPTNILEAATTVLASYFKGIGSTSQSSPLEVDDGMIPRIVVLNQTLNFGTKPNRRKLDELVYLCLQINLPVREPYLLNLEWIQHKISGSDSYHILEDITLYRRQSPDDRELDIVREFVQLSSYALEYDSRQFYTHARLRLKDFFSDEENCVRYPCVKSMFDICWSPCPESLLVPLTPCLRVVGMGKPPVNVVATSPITFLCSVKGDNNFVVSLSEEKNEVKVWDVYKAEAVRTLFPVKNPKSACMIDKDRIVILCGRELKVYDLNEGKLLNKIQGFMNQKMPFYGIHDENHVIALSRNRMYVNVVNIETNEMPAVFKVGEDRFLNSLLISANGKICVCGDETQKPFPLLIWDLVNKKLLYHLYILYHDFLTNLTAISNDGHYVACVAKEVNEDSPNFIIVYDVQNSGTMFKKWKPDTNTTGIAMSGQGKYVVTAVESNWIIVWDLDTGMSRHILIGHSAPVNKIKISEDGIRCATCDLTGKDRSLRLWNLDDGTSLGVFTPDYPIMCCELTPDGRALVVAFKNRSDIVSFVLDNEIREKYNEEVYYGKKELNREVFDLEKKVETEQNEEGKEKEKNGTVTFNPS